MVGRGNIWIVGVLAVAVAAGAAWAQGLSPIEDLGKSLFFDTNLSTPPGVACAACHASEVGFTGPDPLGGSVKSCVNCSGASVRSRSAHAA